MKTVILALCALTSSAAADLIVVDETGSVPGSVATVQAGVDAALAGDTVLIVGSGVEVFDEGVFVDGKGITLISDTGVDARLRTLTIANLPASQRMVVRDVSAGLPGWVDSPEIALRVVNCAGSVRLEGSTFEGDAGSSGSVQPFALGFDGARGASITNCADVVASRCTFEGGWGADLWDEDFEAQPTDGASGVVVTSSVAHFAASEFVGGRGGSVFDTTQDSGGTGGDGITSDGSQVSVAGSTTTGGNGGSGDCELFGCGSGGRGGDGIDQSGAGAVLRVRDVTASGGVGGFSGDGNPAAGGQPIDLNSGAQVVYPSPHRGFELTSPVTAGASVVLTFEGVGGDDALVWPALDAGFAFLPKYQGPYLLGTPALGAGPIFVGTLPPFVAFAVPLTVPPIPGVDALDITIQSVFSDVAGTYLGPAETLTVLLGD